MSRGRIVDDRGYTLLTGVTGLLGRYLYRDLVSQGVPLAVLVRPKGRESAEDRVEALAAWWEANLGRPLARPVCLEGDVTQPGLGLSAEAKHWVASNCGRVVHSAASLVFHGGDRTREPWLSSYNGTRNLVELCKSVGIGELHHTSTAYVCGTRDGTICESDLNVGQGFRNDYEECKCTAEAWLRDQGGLDSLTVYRPAVIVGDSETGHTTTYLGVYRFFQFAWLLAQQAPRGADGRCILPIRLRMTGEECQNLVPVDWVSAVMARLITSPEAQGRTYHLTPAVPTRSSQIEAALADYFSFRGVSFAGSDGAPDETLNEPERLFYDYIDAHEDYLRAEPVFDARNTLAAAPDLPCPEVDAPCLRRLIDFAVHDRWGRSASVSARRKQRQ
ncbi:MAG: SDR family oxidoreductase [Isosphaeraceae bacterium]